MLICLDYVIYYTQNTRLSPLITAQILLYIPANLGIWLIAPIALPFLSYGATALLINMALAGVLLSVFRTGEVYRDTAPHPIFSDSKFIQWADGKLTITFK